jgi:hypothetical protein
MDSWQELRLKRAAEQNILVTHIDCTADSFIFSVQGQSDNYEVEVCQDIDLWPPRCNCEDNAWRPDVRCKHILHCLKLMGVEDFCLEDCYWEPEQHELYEYLFNAPDCVGARFSHHGGK